MNESAEENKEQNDPILYYTVTAEANAEIVIEKSRFIGYVRKTETREEA